MVHFDYEARFGDSDLTGVRQVCKLVRRQPPQYGIRNEVVACR